MIARLSEKLATIAWFARRPSFYPQMAVLIARKLSGAGRFERHYEEAFAWAEALSVPRRAALAAVELSDDGPMLPKTLLAEGEHRARQSAVEMGGPGDLDLLYSAIISSG